MRLSYPSVWETLIALFFYWLEGLKGSVTVRYRVDGAPLTGKITGVFIAGYNLTIYCRRKVFVFHYSNWWVYRRKIVHYQVYSVITPDAPEELRKACEIRMSIPARFHWRVGNHVQQKAAVNAYLDILIESLEPQYRDVVTTT